MCVNTQSNPLSNRYADDIYDAIDGLGTDEEKIISVFQQFKTFDEFCATKTSYANIHKANMLKDIRGDNDQLNIDGSDKEIYKQLSRTVRSLYEKKDEELENRAKQCGYNSVQEYKDSNWYCKPSNTNSSDQNSELLSNAKKCGHNSVEEYKNSGWSCKGSVNERYSPRSQRKIVKLTEKDLTNIVKGVINEETSSKEKDLYTLLHSLRNSINDEDKKKSLSKLEDILSIVRDMEDKDVKHKSKHNIKENDDSQQVIKAKLLNSDGQLLRNLDLVNGVLKKTIVNFEAYEPGENKQKYASFDCRDKSVEFSATRIQNALPIHQKYRFSDAITNKISSQFCDAYGSKGTVVGTSNYV